MAINHRRYITANISVSITIFFLAVYILQKHRITCKGSTAFLYDCIQKSRHRRNLMSAPLMYYESSWVGRPQISKVYTVCPVNQVYYYIHYIIIFIHSCIMCVCVCVLCMYVHNSFFVVLNVQCICIVNLSEIQLVNLRQ